MDDYVSSASPVRAIDAFVDSLDLPALGFKTRDDFSDGRSSYHPGSLLKLYLWGYLKRTRSSRGLENACAENLQAIWLTGNLRPDHSTISDFRKNHTAALKGILREFNLICFSLRLFGRELVAINGTFEALDLPADAPLKVLADTGYGTGPQHHACEAHGTIALAPLHKNKSDSNGLYNSDQFTHDPATDSYTCPQGKTLTRKADTKSRHSPEGYHTYHNSAACNAPKARTASSSLAFTIRSLLDPANDSRQSPPQCARAPAS